MWTTSATPSRPAPVVLSLSAGVADCPYDITERRRNSGPDYGSAARERWRLLEGCHQSFLEKGQAAQQGTLLERVNAGDIGGTSQTVKQTPTVSVLMSVFDCERYVGEAIKSILQQTFAEFEFLIVNDGSRDGTGEILASYRDSRIRIFTQDNLGVARSRNRALSNASGVYVALMDADDIACPDRLERQVSFLDIHPDVGVLGTRCVIRNELTGMERLTIRRVDDDDIGPSLVRGNPIVHSSVMMRRSLLNRAGGYDEKYSFAEDYALWIKLAPITRMANLSRVLLVHREHSETISARTQANLRTLSRTAWVRMQLRYQAFGQQNVPFWYIFYVLQPLVLTALERRR